MLDYVGLTRPYRIERAIIGLLASVAAMAIVVAAIWLAADGDLDGFGPRAHYFLYLLALLALAMGLVRWPWMAAASLILAMVDFAWGVGSYAVRHETLGAWSLLPPDKPEPQRFMWHALLQAVPVPLLQVASATGL